MSSIQSPFHNSDYKPLLADHFEENVSVHLNEKPLSPEVRIKIRHARHYGSILLVISGILNLLLFGFLVHTIDISNTKGPNVFWTPVSSKLKYHVQVFNSGFGNDKTPYQGLPGEETDRVWDDLYVEAFTVTKSEAARQPNKTVTYTADPQSGYVTSFSVMHYLHCLNMVRQMADFIYYPEYYNATKDHNQFTHGLDEWPQFREGSGAWSRGHITHCIDAVRQSLMCQPDLGPVVWQWVPESKRIKVWAETAHSCANWDVIYQYAKERQVYPNHAIPDATVEREAVGRCGYHDQDC